MVRGCLVTAPFTGINAVQKTAGTVCTDWPIQYSINPGLIRYTCQVDSAHREPTYSTLDVWSLDHRSGCSSLCGLQEQDVGDCWVQCDVGLICACSIISATDEGISAICDLRLLLQDTK